jgi:hypothetical protein
VFVPALSSMPGGFLRHWFSHFARGWPGAGLLLIRSLIGLTVISHELQTLLNNPLSLSSGISIPLIFAGILLIIGLWTQSPEFWWGYSRW